MPTEILNCTYLPLIHNRHHKGRLLNATQEETQDLYERLYTNSTPSTIAVPNRVATHGEKGTWLDFNEAIETLLLRLTIMIHFWVVH